MNPMTKITTIAGTRALEALPKAAMAAGRDKPPLPTMFLTRLVISLTMLAVPVP